MTDDPLINYPIRTRYARRVLVDGEWRTMVMSEPMHRAMLQLEEDAKRVRFVIFLA